MIAMVLRHYNFSLERSIVADLRREICRWLNRVLPGAAEISWTFSTHVEAAVIALRIWSQQMHFLPPAQNDAFSAFLWMLRVHLDSVCIGNTTTQLSPDSIGHTSLIKAETRNGNTIVYTIDKALWTIYDLPQIVTAAHERGVSVSSTLLSVFADTCSDIIRTIPLSEVISAILRESELSTVGECARDLSYILQQIWHTVLESHYTIMESRIYRRLMHTLKEEDIFLEDRHFEDEILLYEPDLWAGFLAWMESDQHSTFHQNTKWWSRIFPHYKNVKRWLSAISHHVLNGTVSIDMLKRIASTKGLVYAWTALNSELMQQSILDDMVIEVQNALAEVKSIIKVMSLLAPETSLLPDLSAIVNSWNSEKVCDIRHLLHLKTDDLNPKFAPLPRILLDSLNWLLKNTENLELFRRFWSEHCVVGSDYVNDLLTVRQKWCRFAQHLFDNQLTFQSLENYYNLLRNNLELRSLLRTCDGTWVVLPDTNEFVVRNSDSVIDILKKWSVIQQLYQEREELYRILDVAPFFIEVSAHDGVAHCRDALSALTRDIETNGVWNEQRLHLVDSYWGKASNIDTRILEISKELLEAMRDCAPTLTFLRLIQSDNAFSSSLEIALGLQEMECPPDLWDAKSKRVNERYLSMLRNIRSYLYKCLYEYPAESKSFASFVSLYSSFNRAMNAGGIASNIRECHDVLEGLMQIIQNNSESASQSRLMQLYSVKFDSQWRCMYSNHQVNDCTLYLYYNASKSEDSQVWERHALPELLDFQVCYTFIF